MAVTIADSNILTARRWIEHVLSKMGIDNELVGRVVIDAQSGDAVRIYVAFIGTEDLLEVRAPTAEGVELVCLGDYREKGLCKTCGGKGWIIDPGGGWHPCPSCLEKRLCAVCGLPLAFNADCCVSCNVCFDRPEE